MKTSEIWMLPVERRMQAFIERWLELDEYSGNRTAAERWEMAEIADAILGSMIQTREATVAAFRQAKNALEKIVAYAPGYDWEADGLNLKDMQTGAIEAIDTVFGRALL